MIRDIWREKMIPYNFLNEEKRNEYLVTNECKKVWSVQLDLLEKLMDVCKKNKIPCFAIWGTLLGAVRHKGYIPWDDDLDVGLFRDDYQKLCMISNEKFAEPYFFQTALTDRKYFLPYARLRNSNTTGIIEWNNSEEYNNGIYIDIYPLDGICESDMKRRGQFLCKDFFAGIARSYENEMISGNLFKRLKKLTFKAISCFYSYENACYYHDYWCSKYNETSHKVGLVYHRNLVKTYFFKKEDAEKLILLPFEFLEVPVPSGYHNILTSVYGDYMKFPEEKDRGNWHGNQIIYNADISYIEYIRQHNNS